MELAAAVYRLTEKIPAEEILKRKIREVGLSLLKDFICRAENGIMEKIRLLGVFFILGQKQNWLIGRDCRMIFEKYKNWARQIKGGPKEEKEEIIKKVKNQESIKSFALKKIRQRSEWASLKERQAIIVNILRKKSAGVGFSNLVKILKNKGVSDISSRTVRNDLRRLIEKNIIKQNGWAKNSIYKLTK